MIFYFKFIQVIIQKIINLYHFFDIYVHISISILSLGLFIIISTVYMHFLPLLYILFSVIS